MKNLSHIREVSTLSFNERVLQEAEDARNPLMERLKFLGIFSSNMDEFFKVRVAGLHRSIELGKPHVGEVLDIISQKACDLDDRFRDAYDAITSELARQGIHIITEAEVDQQQDGTAEWLRNYFENNVLPSLVPVILRRDLPFPQIKDGAIYFGVKMWGRSPHYAVLEIPSGLPRFVELPNGNIMYIDDVIRYSLSEIFYIFDYDRIEAFEFKISRDAELDVDNDFSESYVDQMERELAQRKGGRPTRFVYDEAMTPGVLHLLKDELHVTEDDTVMPGSRYHNMKDLMRFPNHRADLTWEPMPPRRHPVLDLVRKPMLETIRQRDILVTYPYQSFGHVIRLLREAAVDPEVNEIKMTLYRAAAPSQVVNALVNAARNGKRIVVSIELQARFDEENNIRIAEVLTENGATVVYGVPPMKTHGKLLLIRRKDTLYAGLSTGNFNEQTGRLYVDSALLTADKRITTEVAMVFDFLERASRMRVLKAPNFKHLLVSPFNSRSMFMRLLARETAKGPDGYVMLKANHLTDIKIKRKIREAADAGVKMDLIIRTTYALKPHDNVRAISILDRFLEHQRVYIFGKGADRCVFMSSADLMERNLDWRVEVAFPIHDPDLQQQVIDIMNIQIADNMKARILDAEQSNQYVTRPEDGPESRRAQYDTYAYYRDLFCRAAQRHEAEITGNMAPRLSVDHS